MPVPERLLIAPQDLRTGDPTIATEIYGGVFSFNGKAVNAEGKSPFELRPPSREWAETLLGFGWLRHLRSAGLALSRKNARALVADWIAQHGGSHPVSWEPEITARRVISWLTHSPLILQDVDHGFYRSFLRSLSRQVRYLRKIYPATREGYPRLLVAIALTFAGLCMAGEGRLLRQSVKRLIDELRRQILAGRRTCKPQSRRVDRNPDRSSAAASGLRRPQLSAALTSSAIRSTASCRCCASSGMATARSRNSTAWARHPRTCSQPCSPMTTRVARRSPMRNIPAISGWKQASRVVIADTGRPPVPQISHEAHAGCLSFEFSAKRNRIVVNCGVPSQNRDAWRDAARATAAHSTAVFHNTSSCRFKSAKAGAHIGAPVASGPA